MEPESSLAPLQVAAVCPYSESDQSSPCLHHPTSWRWILILSSHLRLGLQSGICVNSILIPSCQPCMFAPELILLFRVCDEIQKWPAVHGTGGYSPAFHRGSPGQFSLQSVQKLWWAKWHWDRFFSELGSALSVSFHQCSTPIPFFHHRRCVMLAINSVVK